MADLRTGMYPVFCDQKVVISGEVAKAMYLNAASCFSGGLLARTARPAPPVQQPKASSSSRKCVPTSNLALARMVTRPPVEAIVDAVSPLKKSESGPLSGSCVILAQPS